MGKVVDLSGRPLSGDPGDSSIVGPDGERLSSTEDSRKAEQEKQVEIFTKMKEEKNAAINTLARKLAKNPLSKGDVKKCIGALFSVLKAHETVINMLLNDVANLIQGLEEEKANNFFMRQQTATLFTVLLDKKVINREEMDKAWNEKMRHLKQEWEESDAVDIPEEETVEDVAREEITETETSE